LVYDAVHAEAKANPATSWDDKQISADRTAGMLGLSLSDYTIMATNLLRLELLAPPGTRLSFIEPHQDSVFNLHGVQNVRLSHFGKAFVEVCKSPEATESE